MSITLLFPALRLRQVARAAASGRRAVGGQAAIQGVEVLFAPPGAGVG